VRAEFDLAFRRFSQSMDMLLPDPKALPYNRDLTWLGKIRMTARAKYHDPRLDVSDAGAKVRKLIEDAVIADGIQILVKEVSILAPEFEEKLAALGSPEAKASEMEHAIRHEIHVKLEENPAFYQSLRERLEQLIEAYKQHRIDLARQLELFNGIKDDLKNESKAAEDVGLSQMAFAIYGVLGDDSGLPRPGTYDEGRKLLASRVEETLEPYVTMVDWAGKEDLQRRMRRDVKRVLREAGVGEDEIQQATLGILDLAKARRGK
jgi:type I restriction enzyme R subunit